MHTRPLEALHTKLIISVQASPGEPLYETPTLCRIAQSVLSGGAAGLRAEGPEHTAAFRALTGVPIIAMVKTYDAQGDVYITATFAAAASVANAGADIIALDCTHRRLIEREPWPHLIQRIHTELTRPVCADIATLGDALAAQAAGADAIATTLFGYTADTAGHRAISWPLLESLVANLTVPVILEGHVTHPDDVRRALDLGVHAVVVGSAITRPQLITARFAEALNR